MTTPTSASSPSQDAIKTYRYLRIGIVAVVVLLAASIGYERLQVSCWQTSISAYYYTPVRAVFVGGLVAIGVSLIVIKGSTIAEDTFLNVAGMLAPVVAFVPTANPGTCWSVRPIPLPVEDGKLAPWVEANIHNNITALLIAAAVGLLVAVVVSRLKGPGPVEALRATDLATQLGLLGAAVLLALGTVAFLYWDGFSTHAHYIAAITMFACLAGATAANAYEVRASRPRYARAYLVIAVLMVLTAALFATSFTHKVLVIEAVEIALFASAWVAQTFEHWRGTT
jgi:hypothetical protein